MSETLPDLVRAFDRLRLLIIGDAILDSYLDGEAHRLCREAPVPIVSLNGRRDAAGGAANTAANARRLGANVRFLSVVGRDAEAAQLRRVLDEHGVDKRGLIESPSRTTLAKTRVMAASQMLLRFDQGTTDLLDSESEALMLRALGVEFGRADAVVVSDYAGGVMTPRIRESLTALQQQSPRLLVVDARDLVAYRGMHATAVKPNYDEAVRLLGPRAVSPGGSRVDGIAGEGERLLELTGSQVVAVTLDTEGAILFERNRPPYRTYAKPERHSHAAGAGDTFVAAFTLALAAGSHPPAAAELASVAAAIVVGRQGTSVCEQRELLESFTTAAKCIESAERIAWRARFHKRQGRRIVFTNGCFDILHRGHITYLNRAKSLGDLLIVGINSDESVRRLKGDGRPINTLDDRVQVLAALSCIDHIVPFDGDTASALIEAIRPDVFVKGGDYTHDSLPEAGLVESLGGRVELLPLVDDRSTTGIIQRIREAGAGGRGVRTGSGSAGR